MAGLVRAAEMVPFVYPGCKVVLFYDKTTVLAEAVANATALNVTLIALDPAKLREDGWNFTLDSYRSFRLFALDLPGWDYLLFRDLDSGIWYCMSCYCSDAIFLILIACYCEGSASRRQLQNGWTLLNSSM